MHKNTPTNTHTHTLGSSVALCKVPQPHINFDPPKKKRGERIKAELMNSSFSSSEMRQA